MTFQTATPVPVRCAEEVTAPQLPASQSNALHQLGNALRPHTSGIAATYSLLVFESLLLLAQGSTLGWAVNDLLADGYVGLVAFVASMALYHLVATGRQMHDTRLYTAIYSEVATGVVTRQTDQREDLSCIVARTTLSREIVEFFELVVPLGIQIVFSLAGSLLMLAWFDGILAFYCLLLLVPACLLCYRHHRASSRLNVRLNDQLEKETAVIHGGHLQAVADHYSIVGRWRVALSDQVAMLTGISGALTVVVIAASLLHACRLPNTAAGDLLAAFSYLRLYSMGLGQISVLVGQCSRLNDIIKRL
jgi:hypothetical protein